jgi:hypothetical protein
MPDTDDKAAGQVRRYAVGFGASLLGFVLSLALAYVSKTDRSTEAAAGLARDLLRQVRPEVQRVAPPVPPPPPASVSPQARPPERAQRDAMQDAARAVRNILEGTEREARARKVPPREMEAVREDAARRAAEAAWLILFASEREARKAEDARRAGEREALARRAADAERRTADIAQGAEEQARLVRQVAEAALRQAEHEDRRAGGAGGELSRLAIVATMLGTLVTGLGTASGLLLAWRTERRQAQEFRLKIRQLEHQVRELDDGMHGKEAGA